MQKRIHILLVDDHPMTLWGYEVLLKSMEMDHCLEMESAKCSDEVLKIMKQREHNFFDIVLLDISLPASKDGSVTSGEDLGWRIRQKFPGTKIIVQTALNDRQRIANIFQSFDPDGFMVKSDIDPEILQDAVCSVLNGHRYYSEHTNRLIGNCNHGIFLDTSDRKILYHLSKGCRMKDLPKYVFLSLATIERRKNKLKQVFGVPNGNTKELLDIVRAKGFV